MSYKMPEPNPRSATDDDWDPIPRIMCDEEAHCFVQAVLNICHDMGYPGETGLSVHDWLKEHLPSAMTKTAEPLIPASVARQQLAAVGADMIKMDEKISQMDNLLRRVEATIDAILRGNHSGWDQALAALRNELRKELANV